LASDVLTLLIDELKPEFGATVRHERRRRSHIGKVLLKAMLCKR